MSEPFEYREIEHSSLSYQEVVSLRDVILKKPLGLSYTKEELSSESTFFHLGRYFCEQLITRLVLRLVSCDELQLRQVAVSENWQNRGKSRTGRSF